MKVADVHSNSHSDCTLVPGSGEQGACIYAPKGTKRQFMAGYPHQGMTQIED